MDGADSNFGKQTLDLVRDTLTEYNIPFTNDDIGAKIYVLDLPGQTFGLTLCDEGTESVIFANEASWHFHYNDANEARAVFMNLLEGHCEIETTYRGSSFQSTILQEHNGDFKAYYTRALFNNPFKKLTSKVFRNQVKIIHKVYEESDEG